MTFWVVGGRAVSKRTLGSGASWGGKEEAYGRDVGKVAGAHDPALVAIPELQEALGREEDIVCLGVPVETRRIGEHSPAGEDSNAAVGLLGRGEDAKGAFTAGDGDAFTLELVDDVARAGVGRRGDDGDGHVVRGELIRLRRSCIQRRALHLCTPSLHLVMNGHTVHGELSAPRKRPLNRW